MHHNIHAVHGAQQPVAVAHITDEVAQGRVIVARHAHFMLFEFIAAEDNDLFGLFFCQQHFDEFFTEGTCAAGDEYNFVCPVHFFSKNAVDFPPQLTQKDEGRPALSRKANSAHGREQLEDMPDQSV